MARKKQETLVLFPEVLQITRKFTDAQFGALIRAVFSYRFGGEEYSGDDMAIDVAFQAIANQVDRLKEYSEINAKNAAGSESKQGGAECSEMQGNHPPILSNPIQSVPIQSDPVEDTGAQSAKPPARTRFSPPSVQEIEEYCREKGLFAGYGALCGLLCLHRLEGGEESHEGLAGGSPDLGEEGHPQAGAGELRLCSGPGGRPLDNRHAEAAGGGPCLILPLRNTALWAAS